MSHNTQRWIITEKVVLGRDGKDATDSFLADMERTIEHNRPIRVQVAGREYMLDPIKVELDRAEKF